MSEIAGPVSGLHPLELHYFRVARERWELMLARVRQMGANAVATPIPWAWHAPRDGLFDLSGLTHPARDVSGFLKVCQAMRLPLVLRVSPYVGDGLLEGGLPAWLTREHPEVCALGPDGQPRRDPGTGGYLPCAEHPAYLKFVERWYRELAGALAGWQAPDGPLVALRLEAPGLPDGEPPAADPLAHADYNPHVVHVQWPVWLRQQYAGIDALNAAWQTAYRSFNEAAFPAPTGEPQLLADAARFLAYAAAHAAETYARMLHDVGWRLPVVTDWDSVPPAGQVTHVAQVDPDPPQVGAGVRWAMDAPLRADGSPRPRFWAVKAALLEIEEGVKHVEGGALLSGAQSRRARLPWPAGKPSAYRLLLDGRLLDVPARVRGGALHLAYVAADDAGETDMVLILADRAAPLAGFLHEYLACLLMGKAQALERAGRMCQALAEALAGGMAPAGGEQSRSASEDLQAAEQGLAAARHAASRAAVSLGRLERMAGEIRGHAPSAPAATLPELSAFSPQDLARLSRARAACALVGPALIETARAVAVACQSGETGGEGLTIQGYRDLLEQARGAARKAETEQAGALADLRAELAAGVLSTQAWIVQDWVTRVLQLLTADWR